MSDKEAQLKKKRSEYEAQLRETQRRISEEWSDNEVKIPKLTYGLLSFYQVCLPIFILFGFTWGFFALADVLNWSLPLQVIGFTIVLIVNYLGYIFLTTLFSRVPVHYWEKISPPVQGVFNRGFGEKDIADPRLHYYHLRGFVYKWPVFLAKKSFCPWMLNYALRTVGKNKIHRDAYYMENFPALEETDLGEHFACMHGSTLSSHVVDSLYGNLTIKKVTAEPYATMQPHSITAPGATIKAGRTLFGYYMATKDKVVKKPFSFQYGVKYEYNGLESIVDEEMLAEWEARKEDLADYVIDFDF